MTHHSYPTRVPCAVCLATITGWSVGGRAQPCGHTLDDIHAEIAAAAGLRVEFGQHAAEMREAA